MQTETIQPEVRASVTYTEQELQASDKGPYYLYSFEDVFRLGEMTHHGLRELRAFKVGIVNPGKQWLGTEQVPEGMAQRRRILRDDRRKKIDSHDQITIPASANLSEVLRVTGLNSQLPGRKSVFQIKSFDDQPEVGLEAFHKLIHPVEFSLNDLIEDDKLRVAIEKHGALKVRLDQVRAALKALSTGVFKGRLPDDLIMLYAKAINDDIVPGYTFYRNVSNKYLNEQESLIKSSKKDDYDERDLLLFWMLGRKPKDEATTRALQSQSGGLDADAIRALVETIMMKKDAAEAADAVAPARETMQCPNCGEDVKMIAGGPPRICRFCQHSFTNEAPAADAPKTNRRGGSGTTKAKAN